MFRKFPLYKNFSIVLAVVLTLQCAPVFAGSTALGVPVPPSQTTAVSSTPSETTSVGQKISLSKLAGKVSVRKEGGLLFEDAKDGQAVSMGDTVKTEEGTCVLEMENHTSLTISPNTTLLIATATFDALNKSRATVLKLDGGRLMAKVGKLKNGSTFEVKTPSAVAAVRGTVFYIGAETQLGKLFTELYVDESSGGVIFKNSKTGAEFLVPAFGGSSAFGDGSLLAPHLFSETERNEFIHKWENQINQVLAQIQVEEQAKQAEGDEDGGDDSDSSKTSEQNVSGDALQKKLAELFAKYTQNVAAIGTLTLQSIKDVKAFNAEPVQDPDLLCQIRQDLLENVTDFRRERRALLREIASGEDLYDLLTEDKAQLQILVKKMGLNYVEALGILLNDPLVITATQIGADIDTLLEAAYDVLYDYNLTVENAQTTLDDLLHRQHDLNVCKIENKADRAQCKVDDLRDQIPCGYVTREDVLLKSEGLSEIIAQNAENCEFDPWAYDTVKYADDSNPLGEVFGNGDLGVVAHTSAESLFLAGPESEDPGIDRDAINDRTRSLDKDFSTETVNAEADHLQGLQDDLDQLAEDAQEPLRNKAYVAEANGVWEDFEEYLDEIASEDLAKLQQLSSDSADVEALRAVEREAMRTEIRRELYRISGDLELERQIAEGEKKIDAQTGKVFTDIHGNRVRVDQYVFMPDDEHVQVLSLTLRTAGPQAGISGFSFGVTFNRPFDSEADGPLRNLPWSDYLNVVTGEQVSGSIQTGEELPSDPHFDQYIVHENRSDLLEGESPLYPTAFYAEFRNPADGREGGSDTIRFSETYSDPLTLVFRGNPELEAPDFEVQVQGRTYEAMLIAPSEGPKIELSHFYNGETLSYDETLFINNERVYEYGHYTSEGTQTSALSADFYPEEGEGGFKDLDYYRNLEVNQGGDTEYHIHPAYAADKIVVYPGEEGGDPIEYQLIALFVPLDNEGQLLDAPGFTIRGIRDFLAPNPLVNGGNYNLEAMFYFGHDEYTYNPETESYDRHFNTQFSTDVVITPEIFKPYGTSNSSSLFPAALLEDTDGGAEA